MRSHILSFFFIVLLFTSCVPVKTITTKSTDIQNFGVIQKPTIVDLEVKETKVTGTATAPGQTLDMVKSQAIADALKKVNADVLVEPVFEIITASGQTTVTVTGFPGFYRNFRPMKEEDVVLVQSGASKIVSTANTPSSAPKKNPAGGILLLTLLLVGLGAGLAAVSSKP
jgi:hypothetical protein